MGNKPKEEKIFIQIVEKYLNKKYHFRYNEINDYVEFKLKSDDVGVQMNDVRFNSLIRELKHNKINVKKDELWTIINSDFAKTYNAFKSYFDSLPVWDGNTDYITMLANTVKTSNQELWLKCFKKWFVGVVTGILDERKINETAIIFQGEHGKGKTRWQLRLVPVELDKYFFIGNVNPLSRDSMVHLAECMFIIMDEQANFNKKNVDALKSLMTQDKIRIRRPYGRTNDTLIRRASFMGSVNGIDFLNDTTGSRRFLCFDVLEIDYQHDVSIDLAYSQAVALYKGGFTHWFDDDERKAIELNNEKYRFVSMEEELVIKYFESCKKGEESHFLTTTEIRQKIADEMGIDIARISISRLGSALAKLGFVRVSRNDRKGYLLKVIKINTIDLI